MENLMKACKIYLVLQNSKLFVKTLAQTEIKPQELAQVFRCKMPSSQFLSKTLSICLEIKRKNSVPLLKPLMESLEILKTEEQTLFNCPVVEAMEYNIMKIRDLPKDLLLDLYCLFSLDFLKIAEGKVLEIWEAEKYFNAIELALKFDLISCLGSDLEIVDFLAIRKEHSAILNLIQNSYLSANVVIADLLKCKRTKTVSKLIKSLNLDEGDFPEFLKQETYNFVKYILLNSRAHVPLLQAIERFDPEFTAPVILALYDNELSWSTERAAQIMFNTPGSASFLDQDVIDVLNSFPKRDLKGLPNEFGPLHPSLELSIDPSVNVKLIDKPEDVQLVVWNSSIVGIDLEHAGNYSQSSVSLIQIAAKDSVYLIDAKALGNNSEIASKINCLLEDSGIVKLGIGLHHDLELLNKEFNNYSKRISNYEDISKLYEKSVQDCEGGLGGICSKILHMPLCKAEQCSDWANRPLRLSQLHYAALDAYVLLLLWEKLHSEIQVKEIDYGERCKICARFYHGPEDCDY